jgi:hypothetical protein
MVGRRSLGNTLVTVATYDRRGCPDRTEHAKWQVLPTAVRDASLTNPVCGDPKLPFLVMLRRFKRET